MCFRFYTSIQISKLVSPTTTPTFMIVRLEYNTTTVILATLENRVRERASEGNEVLFLNEAWQEISFPGIVKIMQKCHFLWNKFAHCYDG